MAPKKTIVKHTTRTTNTDTRWVFFAETRWVFYHGHPSSSGNSPRAQPLTPTSLVAPLPAPPPQEVAQDVQPILPYRQKANERP